MSVKETMKQVKYHKFAGGHSVRDGVWTIGTYLPGGFQIVRPLAPVALYPEGQSVQSPAAVPAPEKTLFPFTQVVYAVDDPAAAYLPTGQLGGNTTTGRRSFI